MMKGKIILGLTLLLWLVLPMGGRAEMLSYSVRSMDVDDGLSQNMVYCILQDRTGFLWVGTQDGLNRFDGHNFSLFDANRRENPGSNNYFSLMEDSRGRIWMATLDGVFVYDPITEVYGRFDLSSNKGERIDGLVRHICQDSEGRIWFAGPKSKLFSWSDDEGLRQFEILQGGGRQYKHPQDMSCS